MAPTGQGGQWQDVLCCSLCTKHFDKTFQPVNLICGHVICRVCTKVAKAQKPCPLDDWKPTIPIENYPTNVALLSIVLFREGRADEFSNATNNEEKSIDHSLMAISTFFRKAVAERGGMVASAKLSRSMQRKVVSLMCYQWCEPEGRIKCLKACRAVADRVMTEIILSIQSNHQVSSVLWSAVRSRGCQFLGPAMQDDVLRLMILSLEDGTCIARKNLVMYAVTTLESDYPQVSKTSVGHVVQLLYRASCFNVIKREGESSLMQLKEEFRTYEALRKEHDAQIVQIAYETGLRIGPDQWSALLYADQAHRSHMQSIIDKLQSTNHYNQGIDELRGAINGPSNLLSPQWKKALSDMLPFFEVFTDLNYEDHSTKRVAEQMSILYELLKLRSMLDDNRKFAYMSNSTDPMQQQVSEIDGRRAGGYQPSMYRTKLCPSISKNQRCEKGGYCGYAHSHDQLRVVTVDNAPPPNRDLTYVIDPRYHHMTPPPPIPQFMPPIGYRNGVPPPPMPHYYGAMPPPQLIPIQEMAPTIGSPQTVVIMQSPNHQGPVIITQQPPPPLAATPTQVWAASPTPTGQPVIYQGASPQQGVNTFWIQQHDSNGFPVASFDYIWGPSTALRDSGADAEQLIAKRNEILARLAPHDDDDEGEDGGIGHVSYTVASSVLDDHHPITLIPVQAIELPPIPVSCAMVPMEETINMMGEMVINRPRAPSLTQTAPLMAANGQTMPITVQSTDCGTTNVTESICRPLVAPAIQTTSTYAPPPQMATVVTQVEPFNPSVPPPPPGGQQMLVDNATGLLTPIVRPILVAQHPLDLVSNSLDKIVDVKERLFEAQVSPGSASEAENEHLRRELRQAECDMAYLDPYIKNNCLLMELRQVDRELQQLQIEP